MELKDNDYSVAYNAEEKTVYFGGVIRLQGVTAYEPMKDLLFKTGDSVAAEDTLTLDFQGLKFLNSAGITTLSMFIINMRKKNKARINVVGSKAVAWQEKSLTNLNKIWDSVAVSFKD